MCPIKKSTLLILILIEKNLKKNWQTCYVMKMMIQWYQQMGFVLIKAIPLQPTLKLLVTRVNAMNVTIYWLIFKTKTIVSFCIIINNKHVIQYFYNRLRANLYLSWAMIVMKTCQLMSQLILYLHVLQMHSGVGQFNSRKWLIFCNDILRS